MNLNILEKLVRQTLRGENVAGKRNSMWEAGTITAAEYRSLKSIRWQVAAKTQINGGHTGL